MKRLLIAVSIVVQAGCLFSDSSEVPNMTNNSNSNNATNNDAGNNETNNSNNSESNNDPGNNGTNNSNNNGNNSNNGTNNVSNNGNNQTTNNTVNNTNNSTNNDPGIFIAADITPTEIRVLDGAPFHILLADGATTEIWRYRDGMVQQWQTIATGAPISAVEHGNSVWVAGNGGAFRCPANGCITSGTNVVGVGVNANTLFTVTRGNNALVVQQAGADISQQVANPITFSIRSFPASRFGGILVTDNRNYHVTISGSSRLNEPHLYANAIPNAPDRLIGLRGNTLNSKQCCGAIHGDVQISPGVTAFDTYRYGNAFYVAYATMDRISIVEGADATSVATINEPGVTTLGFAVRDEEIVVVFRNSVGVVEVVELNHSPPN